MSEVRPIRPRERDAIIQSLGAGVVPRVGQQHIQVGRADEVKALLKDIERVADAGAAIRFVIGEYGAGKTFFLCLIRSIALEKKLVTIHADLTPDRRFQASGGQAQSLYAELMRNLATRAKPDGGALSSVVERFVTQALGDAKRRSLAPEAVIQEQLQHLTEMVGGYDFANVIAAYWRGHDTGNEQLKVDAVRWLRGEFSTKTEARAALGVRTIIDDEGFYDHLKLMARFVRLAGYGGLLACFDELVNIYKLSSSKSRNANYERILSMLNDGLQGAAVGLGILLGGTPDSLLDVRRGMYSYEALQSRLAENSFAAKGLVDLNGPVLRLADLSPEDLFVLLGNIRHVFASGDASKYLIPDEALQAFMAHCSKRVGEAYFRTPRTTIKQFVHLLNVLEQNPGSSWADLLGATAVEVDKEPDAGKLSDTEDEVEAAAPAPIAAAQKSDTDDDQLATFKLK